MSFTNEKLVILYGSQTGNSQDVAERIWRESKRYYFKGTVCCMDDYNIVDLVNEKCAIFVCSTTGQGDEPDNMKSFWKFLLRKSLPPDSLNSLRYAVLGLGDSSYVKFNFAAKRLNKRLLQLGAQELIPVGLGDDQHDLGYDAVADPWIDLLWQKLLTLYPLPSGISPFINNRIEPRWNVFTKLQPDKVFSSSQSIYYSSRPDHEFFVTVKDNIRVTHHDHFQDVRLIKLKADEILYNPGDVISLRPRNLPSQVKYFQEILKDNGVIIPPDTIFKLTEKSSETPVPPHFRFEVSFQQLCDEYFDLMAIPRRHHFNILAQLTDSDLEKEKCLEFTTAEGQQDLYNYCNRPRRNITEVLEDFRHATKNLTADILFELLMPIKPRDFSIASSCVYHKNEIHILVAVVKYKTKMITERFGLCSNFLADLKEGEQLSVWIKKGSFRFPEKLDGPVIMVGPGTGVAPFRNYIFEQISKDETADKSKLILFFGCRNRDMDFYCGDEYNRLADEGKVTFITAFSRDQDKKIYVQDKIAENAPLVWNALCTGKCNILVAGNSKNMPQAVRDAFKTICEQEGKMTSEQAEAYIATMERKNMYQTETWS